MIAPGGLLTPRDLSFPTTDGLTLSAWWWHRPESACVVVIGHGLGEHGGLYAATAAALLDEIPASVLAFDFRGHGRSPGQRGYVRDYADFTVDWQSALAVAARECPGVPVFALGHSNGGLSVLLAAVEGRLPGCSGLIVSNPALSIRMAVPTWKLAIGRVLRRIAPRVTLPGDLSFEDLTRDPLERDRRRNDRAVHGRISAPLFFGMREAARRIEAEADRLTLPLLVLLGGSDPIIDPAATRRLFDRVGSPDRTLLEYPSALHEPLADVGREVVWADIARWVSDRLGERGTAIGRG